MDLASGRHERAGRAGSLSPREREVLALLVEHQGQVVGRDALLLAVWGEAGSARAVDTVVRRLRAKLEADPAHPDHLVTVHGEGYRLVLAEPDPEPVPAAPSAAYALGRGTVDVGRREWRDERGVVALTTKEAGVLQVLIEAAGDPVARDELLKRVWGYRRASALRYVDTAVHGLRHKIEADPSTPHLVLAVPGVGYRLELGRPEGNLGAETSRFFGRHEAIGHLDAAWAAGVRLVVVSGPGGVGKTRLVRHWAQQHVGAGEVWFVDLTCCHRVGDVVEAVAGTLEVQAGAVEHALAGRASVLLLLDNAEQVEPGLADLVTGWLARTRGLRLVLTSRRRLDAVDETVVALEPLDEADALALFVDRVHQAWPSWDPAPHSDDLVTLVQRLDALPLALELAAARVGVRSPRAVLEALEQRFALLSRGSRSLWASLSWSWDLLSPREQAAFARLAAFRGGWFLEDFDDPDLLEGLVAASMVRVDPGHPIDVRFDLLVSIRELAVQRLPQPWLDEGARWHAERFGERARRWVEAWHRRGDPAARAWLGAQEANLAAAVDTCPEVATACLLGLCVVLSFDGTRDPTFVLGGLDRCIPRVGGDLRARLLHERSTLHLRASALPEAARDLEQGLTVAEDPDLRLELLAELHRAGREVAPPPLEGIHPVSAGRWWRACGEVAMRTGHHALAEDCHQRALALFEQAGNRGERAKQVFNLALVQVLAGNPERGLAALEQAVADLEARENRWGAARALSGLGVALVELGDARGAEALSRALAVFEAVGSVVEATRTRMNLGNAARDTGDATAALAHHQRALAQARQLAQAHLELLCLLNVAVDEATLDRPEEARAALEEAEACLVRSPTLRGRAAVAALKALLLGSEEALAVARDLEGPPEVRALVAAAGGDRTAVAELAPRSQLARWAAAWLER